VFTRPFHGFVARLRAAVDSDAAGLKQALAALLVSSAGDLLAGVTLGAISDTLALLPGLLVLVPAAIGMRGNIFGALGSRLFAHDEFPPFYPTGIMEIDYSVNVVFVLGYLDQHLVLVLAAKDLQFGLLILIV